MAGSAQRRLKSVLGPLHYDELHVARAVLPRSGVMIDVGAHYGSSLEPFARDGWVVHAFEPDPANRSILVKRTRHLDRVTIIPKAVTERSGDEVELFSSSVSTGISTLHPFHESHESTARVATISLRDYCSANNLTQVDLLKIDVEGYDLFALRSFPFDSLTPGVITCEFEDRKTVPLGYTWTDLAGLLSDRGYHVLVSEWHPISEYGARHSWRRLVEYPVELASSQAWGNLIGVRSLPAAEAVMRQSRRFERSLPLRAAAARLVARARS